MQKSRKKGLLAGLVNVGVEITRQSHESSMESTLEALADIRQIYDRILLGCDQLIHQIEVLMAQGD